MSKHVTKVEVVKNNAEHNGEEIVAQELLKQGNNVDIKLNSLVSQAL
jgi:hypothetical protein